MFEISQKQLSFKDFQHHRDNWRLFQDASVGFVPFGYGFAG